MSEQEDTASISEKIRLSHCTLFKARHAFREAITMIESVHLLGRDTLPITIRCRTNDTSPSSYFRIQHGFPVREPTELQIFLVDNEPESDGHLRLLASMLHEIGHALDFAYEFEHLPIFRSQIDPLWTEWRKAVMQSKHVATLTKGGINPPRYAPAENPSFQVPDVEYELSVWRNLQPNELWARAYAQYIASKCNFQDLTDKLSSIHDYEHLSGRPVPPSRQWDANDFVGISVAMDSIFESLGWQID